MKLTHIIAFGNQIITRPIDDEHIDAEFNALKAQIKAQNGDDNMLHILTDIELEEGEYEISEVDK